MANKQFANVPPSKQAAMERCVLKLKNDPKFKPRKGRTREQSAIAVCFESVVRGKDIGEFIEMTIKDEKKKAKRRERKALKRAKEKQAAGEPLSHEEQTALAKASFKSDSNISKEDAAAEVVAAISGETDKIEVTEDVGDLLEFERDPASDPEEKSHTVAVEVLSPDLPVGGATTFDELDDYREAREEAWDIKSVIYDFEMLVDNVLAKSDPGELGDKIVALGSAMKDRLEDPPERKEKGVVTSLKDRLVASLEKAKRAQTLKETDLISAAKWMIQPGHLPVGLEVTASAKELEVKQPIVGMISIDVVDTKGTRAPAFLAVGGTATGTMLRLLIDSIPETVYIPRDIGSKDFAIIRTIMPPGSMDLTSPFRKQFAASSTLNESLFSRIRFAMIGPKESGATHGTEFAPPYAVLRSSKSFSALLAKTGDHGWHIFDCRSKAGLTQSQKNGSPEPAFASVDKRKSSGFQVFKSKDGFRWFGWVSNKYRDRDWPAEPKLGGQILTEAAHKEFVAWVDEDPKENMPRLWPWHTLGGEHKDRADWIDYVDGFLVMSGPLTEKEGELLTVLGKEYDLAMSHGLVRSDLHYDKERGLIQRYRTFEASYLPREFAANEWTDIISIAKEVADMGFTPEKRTFLERVLGEEKVMELEQDTEGRAKELDELGIEWKGLEEALSAISEPDETEEEEKTPETEAVPVKEFEGLSEFLEKQSEATEANSKAILEIGDVLVKLSKSDDEKVAEVIRPKISMKDTKPIWQRSASESKENIIEVNDDGDPKDEEDKDLLKSKPGNETHWMEEVLGAGAVEVAPVPK